VSSARILHLDSLSALRSKAEAWDDLWRRSRATLPSLCAEPAAQWVEHFASPDRFHAVVVEAEGRWVAALPTVRRKAAGLIEVAALPCNEWSASGELLLDESAEPAAALEALAASLRELPWPMLWLDEVAIDAPHWRQFHAALVRAGMTIARRRRFEAGRVETVGDWAAYRRRWSRKHRQTMARAVRRMTALGGMRLDVVSRFASGEVAAWMRRGFAVEDRGWKGRAGSSILRSPDMADFYLRLAQQAARCGHLELAMLRCGDRDAAFSFGLTAKGVFHSIKIGYDETFAACHPGQLLRGLLLERFFADPEHRVMDFQGPMTEAHAAWRPKTYPVVRLAVGPRKLSGRAAVWAYQHLWPLVARR